MPCLYCTVCMCIHLQLTSELPVPSVGSRSCTSGHANLLSNVKQAHQETTAHQYHRRIPFSSLLNCCLSCCYPWHQHPPPPNPNPNPHPTTPPCLSPSAVCTAAVGWKMAWKWGLAQGCQRRHNRYTHSPSNTRCVLFLALLCHFSSLLPFCLFYRWGERTRDTKARQCVEQEVNKRKSLRHTRRDSDVWRILQY